MAFIVSSISFILYNAFPVLENIKKEKEIKEAIEILKKIKEDSYYLSSSAYGNEFSYSINLENAYIVTYKNDSHLYIRFTDLSNFPFNVSSFKDNEVEIYKDFDQLVLKTQLTKKFLTTFSSKAKGTFYLRNKVIGFILTNKKGDKLNLNFNITPSNCCLSWGYDFKTNFYKKWADIWIYYYLLDLPNIKYNGYFYENLTKFSILFKNPYNKSSLVKLALEVKTDFGDYDKKIFNLEVPYNYKVNITFKLKNINNIDYLNLSFFYIGKLWKIALKNIKCGDNMKTKTFSYESFSFSYNYTTSSNKGPCDFKLNLFNVPTYANYTLNYKHDEIVNDNRWYVITPYIACYLGEKCENNKYWKNLMNTFYFEDKKVVTIKQSTKYIINNNLNRYYKIKNKIILINLK